MREGEQASEKENKGQFTPYPCSLASDYEHRVKVLISVKIKLCLSPIFFLLSMRQSLISQGSQSTSELF